LADEPTASLDTKRAHEVVGLIAHEVKSRKKAAIMVPMMSGCLNIVTTYIEWKMTKCVRSKFISGRTLSDRHGNVFSFYHL